MVAVARSCTLSNQLQTLDKQAQVLAEVQRAFEEFDVAREKLGEALLRLNKPQRVEVLSEILSRLSNWRKTLDERNQAPHMVDQHDDEERPGPTRTILRILKANPQGLTRKQIIKECSLANMATATTDLDALITALLSSLRRRKKLYRDDEERYFARPPKRSETGNGEGKP